MYLLVYMWYMWCGCVSNEEHKIDAYEQTSRSWIDSRLGMGRFRTRQLHLLPPADSINPAGPSHCLLVCMYVRIYIHTYIAVLAAVCPTALPDPRTVYRCMHTYMYSGWRCWCVWYVTFHMYVHETARLNTGTCTSHAGMLGES